MTLQLLRATEADLEEIVQGLCLSFTDDVDRLTFLDPYTAEGRERFRASCADGMRNDTFDYWLKVVDTTTGKIAAASNWHIFPNNPPPKTELKIDLPWLKDNPEQLKRSTNRKKLSRDRKIRLVTGPYVELNICFTLPQQKRRGAGAMMLKWGCDLADQLGLPMWICATPEGQALYEKFGAAVIEEPLHPDVLQPILRRDAVVKQIVGGKAQLVVQQ